MLPIICWSRVPIPSLEETPFARVGRLLRHRRAKENLFSWQRHFISSWSTGLLSGLLDEGEEFLRDFLLTPIGHSTPLGNTSPATFWIRVLQNWTHHSQVVSTCKINFFKLTWNSSLKFLIIFSYSALIHALLFSTKFWPKIYSRVQLSSDVPQDTYRSSSLVESTTEVHRSSF